jgi:hypothetical protein
MRTVVAILTLSLAGCAAKAQVATTPPPPAPVPVRPAPPPVDSPRVRMAETGDDAYLGTIDRAGLVAILDQGLGRFLTHVRLEPALSAGKFQGFRVGALDPAWQGVGLESGDVITRVNGQPIERPEQALSAFESLRTASEVKVDLLRGGVPSQVRYRID